MSALVNDACSKPGGKPTTSVRPWLIRQKCLFMVKYGFRQIREKPADEKTAFCQDSGQFNVPWCACQARFHDLPRSAPAHALHQTFALETSA